ncbi:hypothetical protein [Teredinibacter purpureus]|uniref:hypothetical protein n=1 Tax=Teredinibacter purpureus TaxID=2731756 RepID=UPI0005F87665|nr:hypothetical protein [Teredinibacter purpureus]
MEVRVNTKKQILKSFAGWLPLALVAIVFYGMIFTGLIMWLLTKFAGIEQELARQIGLPVGGVLLVASLFLYFNWLTKSLSSFHLAIEGDNLLVKGIAGWSTLDKEVPINTIKKIYIGANANSLEKLSSGHGAINDQVASRLTFFPYTGKTFKLDFAAKAFNNESLYKFLVAIKGKGVETNVSV